MSSATPGGDLRREIPEGPRPLPAYPSLEFERKRAKKLLREMRRADPAAKLSDAQFTAAREYGFSSWPRLVDYFTVLERHAQSGPPPAWSPLSDFEKQAEWVLARLRRANGLAAAQVAAFVPQFYGKTPIEVLESTVSIEDARLVIARQNRYPSWEAFVGYVQTSEDDHDEWLESPTGRAINATRKADLDSLSQIVDAHPEVLAPPNLREAGKVGNLLFSALSFEFKSHSSDARNITNWLVSRGANLPSTLNLALLRTAYGYIHEIDSTAEWLEFLIDRGADPNWIPPNGLTLLEHALLRPHRRSTAIDAFLRYITPRKAFWVAAALGDIESLNRYFDKTGKLTPSARKDRPDFTAAGPFSLPLLPDVDDIDIMWEAFYIAVQREQFDSMDVLLDHGLPVDHAPWVHTMMAHATNARDVALVEYLLKRGATMDVQGATAEQMDQWLYQGPPTDPKVLRIYELSGGENAEEVMRRYETRTIPPPEMHPALVQVIELAKEEAARLGQTEVLPENLFYAMFRGDTYKPLPWLINSGVDAMVLKRSIEDRLVPKGEIQRDVPLSVAATDALALAKSVATQKQRPTFNMLALLDALVVDDNSTVAEILVRAGADLPKLREALAGD